MSKAKPLSKKPKKENYSGSWISIDGGPFKKCIIRTSFIIRESDLKVSHSELFGKDKK